MYPGTEEVIPQIILYSQIKRAYLIVLSRPPFHPHDHSALAKKNSRVQGSLN